MLPRTGWAATPMPRSASCTRTTPATSILGFLLSMAAALGAQVAIFQWGWGQHIFGITPAETISFLPIIMLDIVFGLSSDSFGTMK